MFTTLMQWLLGWWSGASGPVEGHCPYQPAEWTTYDA